MINFKEKIKKIINYFKAEKWAEEDFCKKNISARCDVLSETWTVLITTVCVYSAAILAQYNYVSYFNIPSSFIEFSIRENVIYFLQLFYFAYAFISLAEMWLLFFLVIVFILSFYMLRKKTFLILIIFLLLFVSFEFGGLVAEKSPFHYVLSSGCLINNKNEIYIIPAFYDGKMILVPVDENNKMKKSFLIKDIAESGCLIERKDVGKILK